MNQTMFRSTISWQLGVLIGVAVVVPPLVLLVGQQIGCRRITEFCLFYSLAGFFALVPLCLAIIAPLVFRTIHRRLRVLNFNFVWSVLAAVWLLDAACFATRLYTTSWYLLPKGYFVPLGPLLFVFLLTLTAFLYISDGETEKENAKTTTLLWWMATFGALHATMILLSSTLSSVRFLPLVGALFGGVIDGLQSIVVPVGKIISLGFDLPIVIAIVIVDFFVFAVALLIINLRTVHRTHRPNGGNIRPSPKPNGRGTNGKRTTFGNRT